MAIAAPVDVQTRRRATARLPRARRTPELPRSLNNRRHDVIAGELLDLVAGLLEAAAPRR